MGGVTRARQLFTTLGSALRNPSIRRAELAWGAAISAEWAHFVAFGVYAYDVGGPTAVGIAGTIMGVVLVHASHALVYSVWITSAAFSSVDRDLELAARNMGAAPLRTFFTITLPLAAPGVFAGSPNAGGLLKLIRSQLSAVHMRRSRSRAAWIALYW